jgi:hypothetical protein
MNSPEAIELLMMTAAQESFCGRYVQQQGCGVALGIFQMEPATYRDLFDNYLIYNGKLKARIDAHFYGINSDNFHINLRGNIPYQIVLSRLQYRRFPTSIPSVDDELALARYYKRFWNTELGDAQVKTVIRNYHKYAK